MRIALCTALGWLFVLIALPLGLVWLVLLALSALLWLLSVYVHRLLLGVRSLQVAFLARILGLEASERVSTEIT